MCILETQFRYFYGYVSFRMVSRSGLRILWRGNSIQMLTFLEWWFQTEAGTKMFSILTKTCYKSIWICTCLNKRRILFVGGHRDCTKCHSACSHKTRLCAVRQYFKVSNINFAFAKQAEVKRKCIALVSAR